MVQVNDGGGGESEGAGLNLPMNAAAAQFDVSVSFVVKLMAVWYATGSLAPKPEGGWRYSKLDPHRLF